MRSTPMGGILKYEIVVGKGDKQGWLHLHAIMTMHVQDSEQHRRAFKAFVRAELGMGKAIGQVDGKVQIKASTNIQGLYKYLSKGVDMPHFQFCGNQGTTREDWLRVDEERPKEQCGTFGLQGNLTRFTHFTQRIKNHSRVIPS